MCRALLAAVAALALLPLSACSGCDHGSNATPDAVAGAGGGGGSGAADAGTGGSPPDTGTGASGGLGGSGATGGAATDAGGDVWTTDPTAWKTPSWNPPECDNLFRAVDLAKALPPLSWVPCNNGIAGCRLMDTSMLPGLGAHNPNEKLGALPGVYQYGSRTIFTVGVNFGWHDNAEVMYELDKGAIAAWRTTDLDTKPCLIGRAYLWKGGVLQQLNIGLEAGTLKNKGLLHYGPVDPIANDTAPSIWIDQTVTGNPYKLVLSGELGVSQMALEIGPGGSTIYVWDMASGKPVPIPKPPGSWDDYRITVKGAEVLFERDSGQSESGIALRHSDGSVVMLYQKPNDSVGWLASDGSDVVWQELTLNDAGSSGKLELWTSPWADDAASFKPRKVYTFASSNEFALGGYSGGGWYPYRLDDGTLRAVRLSDGAYIDVPAPPGHGWMNPWGVVNGEIWSLMHIPRGAGLGIPNTIARIPVASLGAPTP